MHLALSCHAHTHTHTHTFTQPKRWLYHTIGMRMTDRYPTAIMQIMNDYWYDAWEDFKLVHKTGLLIHYSWLQNALTHCTEFMTFFVFISDSRALGPWLYFIRLRHHGSSRFDVIFVSLYNPELRDEMKVRKLLHVTPTYSIYPVISIHMNIIFICVTVNVKLCNKMVTVVKFSIR